MFQCVGAAISHHRQTLTRELGRPSPSRPLSFTINQSINQDRPGSYEWVKEEHVTSLAGPTGRAHRQGPQKCEDILLFWRVVPARGYTASPIQTHSKGLWSRLARRICSLALKGAKGTHHAARFLSDRRPASSSAANFEFIFVSLGNVYSLNLWAFLSNVANCQNRKTLQA